MDLFVVERGWTFITKLVLSAGAKRTKVGSQESGQTVQHKTDMLESETDLRGIFLRSRRYPSVNLIVYNPARCFDSSRRHKFDKRILSQWRSVSMFIKSRAQREEEGSNFDVFVDNPRLVQRANGKLCCRAFAVVIAASR